MKKEKLMGRSPLDTAFGSASTQEKRSKKGFAYVALLGVAGLASASSVFAANVSINSDAAISYSQGTTTIAACDTDGIEAELGATYVAADNTFVLDTIELTDVAAGCDGKTLNLAIYDGANLMAAVTGEINTDASTTVLIGREGTALANGNDTAASAAVTDLQGTVTTEYGDNGGSDFTAAELASDADRIVIEIN
jgi:hypothetical protein